ncbi:hypothetical protein [Mesorhizobium sp. 131-2-5]|uniref:hypothetical protein n=1 Tax=Mesorhizobium sp. 131-2-5 TaxID=2744519 RepID=UPI00192650DC
MELSLPGRRGEVEFNLLIGRWDRILCAQGRGHVVTRLDEPSPLLKIAVRDFWTLGDQNIVELCTKPGGRPIRRQTHKLTTVL